MSGMKITPVSAMRARDVSRPRAEHLAAAAEREEAFTRQADKHAGRDAPGAVTPMPTPPKAVPPKAVPPKDNR